MSVRRWIGAWHDAVDCPACGVWDSVGGPHAAACQLANSIYDYMDDIVSGRVNEPGYWTALEELNAKYPSA